MDSSIVRTPKSRSEVSLEITQVAERVHQNARKQTRTSKRNFARKLKQILKQA